MNFFKMTKVKIINNELVFLGAFYNVQNILAKESFKNTCCLNREPKLIAEEFSKN
jgi:hypothetical protein